MEYDVATQSKIVVVDQTVLAKQIGTARISGEVKARTPRRAAQNY